MKVTEPVFISQIHQLLVIVNMNIDKLIKRKQHARRDNNTRQLAEITKTLGDFYLENERPKEALQEYTEQLCICEDLGDKLSCAIAHRMIGEAHVSLGDYEQALTHQKQHLEGARDMKNLIEQQRAFATLGRTHLCLAESLSSESRKRDEALASAKTAFVKSMELCDQLTGVDIRLEERTQMRARLLLNLGLTLEAQKETRQAIDLIEQATALCVSNNIQEDLYRTCISLAGIYERQGDLELALNYFETASTVKDPCLRAKAKIFKAELFLQSGQWIRARRILVALYTSSGLPGDVNCQVEKYLRIVVTLCRAENGLLVETDALVKQKLYETLGDAAVAVQCYDKGADYYRQMLSCAEETGEQVAAALSSLAQTLKDAGRCEEALPYARREFELWAGNPREKCKSSLFLADLLAMGDAAETPEIRECYVEALRLADEAGDTRLRRSTAKEYVAYLNSVGRFDEAEDARRTAGLPATSETSSDTESEGSEQIGADICLEDLSDLEIEENVTSRASRRREKRAIRRNEKGETQLHVACINGDVDTVERLLSSGHPTNVRDHCGWSPLHEAANHGHVEVAEALLKHDANVNDPGGASCKGVTPLHDAASCGHFSMMQLLMQHGANLTLKTHDGDTVLDCLEDWRDRVADLSPEDQLEYDTMRRKLFGVIVSSRKRRRKPESVYASDRKLVQPEAQKISAGEDYKRTIASLRTFNKTKKINAPGKSGNDEEVAPLVNEEQVLMDDWLEDDMAVENTARKRSKSSRHVAACKRKSADNSTESTSKRLKRLNSTVESDEDLRSTSEESDDSTLATGVIEVLEEAKRREKKRQVSLLSNGFTVSRTPSPMHDLQSSLRTSASSKRSCREHVDLSVLVTDKVFEVKVDACEDETEFLVCVVSAAERAFFSETGCTAKLTLRPLNGSSVVTKESVLRMAREGTNDANVGRLECEIAELQVPSIVERYRTICSTGNVTPCEVMLKCLRSCENTSLFRVRADDVDEELLLVPLLRTLEYQKNMKLLQLSGIVLSTAGAHLRQCLSNLSSLQELHLRGCNIDFACLREITRLPSQLRLLDLSYNPLSAESHETLQKLIAPLRHLQTLNLRYCELEEFRLPLHHVQPVQQNPNLTNCDISWNKLSRDSTASFLGRRMFDLNLSNTLPSHGRFTSALETLNMVLSPSLESLELSFCDVTDYDVRCVLEQLPRLMKLILSGNKSVTVSSVNMLLSRKPTLTFIDVSGCSDIVSGPEAQLFIQNPETCTLVASVEPDLCDSWIKLWRDTGIVTRLPHNVTIFKPF